MLDKVRKLLFGPETAETPDQVSRFPGWKLHPLKADLDSSVSRYSRPPIALLTPQRHHRIDLGRPARGEVGGQQRAPGKNERSHNEH
jgi:hypothetical protein